MLRPTSVLVMLVQRVDRLLCPPKPCQRARGRPKTSLDRLLVKAVVMMLIRRRSTADALLAFRAQDDPLPSPWHPLLCAHGRWPSRRTWERRRAALPQHVPGLMGGIGCHVVTLLRPWATHGRAVACARPPLELGGRLE